LLDIDINGARGVLFNITGGLDLTLNEVSEAADIISQAAHPEAEIIFGAVQDPAFDGKVKITVIATGFDGQVQPARPQPGRMEYNRSMFYSVAPSSNNGNGSTAPRQPVQSVPQGYGSLPVTPPPVNISRHPTGPLQPAARPMPQPHVQMREPLPVPISAPSPVSRDAFDDEFDTGNDSADVLEVPSPRTRLPMPEPEAQPAQRPSGDPHDKSGGYTQRPIRRMDPKAYDLPRGSRNVPHGDVIDIPAFLRKR